MTAAMAARRGVRSGDEELDAMEGDAMARVYHTAKACAKTHGKTEWIIGIRGDLFALQWRVGYN